MFGSARDDALEGAHLLFKDGPCRLATLGPGRWAQLDRVTQPLAGPGALDGLQVQRRAGLDREEGGKKELLKSGIQLHALLKISEVANALYEIGAIDEENLKTILKQIKK